MDTIDIVRMLGTEFSDVETDTVNNWIELCKPMVSKKAFGEMYNTALALYVCHKMKMGGLGETLMGGIGTVANAFAVTSLSDGGTSLSFAASGASTLTTDAEFTLTIYGAQFLQLRKQFVVPIAITGGLM